MGEVRKHLKRVQIDHPQAALGSDPMISLTGRARRHGIGEDKRQEVRQLILSGLPHAEVVRRTGVSSGTVSAIRQELKAAMPLYRNTEFGDCVPLACRLRAAIVTRTPTACRKPLERLVGPAGFEPTTTPL